MSHTPEPWNIETLEASTYTVGPATINGLANATRLMTCVNACAGLTETQIQEAVKEWKERHASVEHRQAARCHCHTEKIGEEEIVTKCHLHRRTT